jgi:hypothetical protein
MTTTPLTSGEFNQNLKCIKQSLENSRKYWYIQTLGVSWAHNPKVVSSNLAPATKLPLTFQYVGGFRFWSLVDKHPFFLVDNLPGFAQLILPYNRLGEWNG